jgi:hypothetical protein
MHPATSPRRASFTWVINAVKFALRFKFRPYASLAKRETIFGPSFSDAGQDLLVTILLPKKRGGYYVEIGSQDPIKNNNTFMLETYLDWSGLAFELRNTYADFYNWRRRNDCIQCDATEVDYAAIFDQYKVPERIHFLQVDIEPSLATLAALKALPHEKFRFSIIVFEHDNYQSTEKVDTTSRRFLSDLGYHLLVEDVQISKNSFEDWWIDPTCSELPDPIKSQRFIGLDYFEALKKINDHLILNL